MNLNPVACYRAVQARDARYDGRFFTCVKTTGIYCRPICPARPPKLENCTFVPTAAAAQAAGYRHAFAVDPKALRTLTPGAAPKQPSPELSNSSKPAPSIKGT